MSKALVCDNCDTSLRLNKRGEADNGEDAAWIQVSAIGLDDWLHACTRSCAVQLIESGPFAEAVDAQAEVIAQISRTIAEERAREDEGED